MRTHTISSKDAKLSKIVSRRDIIRDDAVLALSRHGSSVRTELDAINTLSHATRSRHAAAFAILSPQAAFDANVRAIRPLLASLDNNVSPDVLLFAIRSAGHTMNHDGKAAQYIASRHIITQASADELTFDNVRTYAGFGDKTTSMYLALYSEHSRVMTLDTWMLNGLLGELSGTWKNTTTYTASTPAYRKITEMLLGIADELNVSPFMLQWSMWNLYRMDTHESHTAIFGL